MESASCGPSNPLKNLSNQLDRNNFESSSSYRSFPSSNQQFRSQRAENSSLNHEFAQFNGPPSSSSQPLMTEGHVPFNNHDTSFLIPQNQEHPVDILQPSPQHDWSLQFSNLYLRDSETSSLSSSVFTSPAMTASTNAPQQMFNNMVAPSTLHYSQQASNSAQEQHAPSMAALDQAFADAFDAVFQDIHPVTSELEDTPSPQVSASAKEKEIDNQKPLIGENDALSRTAGELYEKLNNDASNKFKNSNFLSLMRKLRDKQVVVDNHNLVDSEDVSFASSSFELSAKELASNSDEKLRTTDWEENFF